MKSIAIFLTLTIAAAAATIACGGGETPAADPSTVNTAASGEMPSTDAVPASSDTPAAPAPSGM